MNPPTIIPRESQSTLNHQTTITFTFFFIFPIIKLCVSRSISISRSKIHTPRSPKPIFSRIPILGIPQSSAMTISPTFLFSCALFLVLASTSSVQAQNCNSLTFSNASTSFQLCTDLPALSSSIHWTRNSADGTVRVAFFCPGVSASSPKWCAWGPNLSGGRMVGTQALVGFVDSSGSPRVRTVPVTSYATQLAEGNLSFPVTGLRVALSNGGMEIFATLQIPSSSLNTMTQVWQIGDVGSGGTLQQHPLSGQNVQSVARWDLNSGETSSAGGVPRLKKKNVHGVLNAVSWGVLMPIGAMFARYLKVSRAADPAWFYLHITCQISAYAVGVAGWGTGLKLGSDSSGIKYNPHRNIGIALFCLATLQVFALLLRPKKDHKYRLYWNIYHHSIGYTVIILSVINVYKGFDILDPEKKWKRAYTGVIIALGAVAVLLEAFTWMVVLRRRKNEADKSHRGANGVNGL